MGGSGVISEVTDRRLHRTRALKTPRPDPDDSALFDKTLRFTTRRSRGSPRSARGSRPTPAAAGETSALRDVAAQLRDVASSLRSPVLDHLGIGPALEDLGEALSAAYPGRRVLVAVDDFTARGGRPPSDVEVAAFRVAQEASGNALRHATGPTVRITATVAAGAVDVAVADDGPGIDRDAAARARRGGHFGLDSMRERAAAVGDRVEIESGASGTTVRFAWERGA
jgi:signal transduction histidine kinase